MRRLDENEDGDGDGDEDEVRYARSRLGQVRWCMCNEYFHLVAVASVSVSHGTWAVWQMKQLLLNYCIH